MSKSKDGWTWNRSNPLYDFVNLGKSLTYTAGGFDINIPNGKAYYLAFGKILDTKIKKITLNNDEITSVIVPKDKDIYWFQILDNKDLNRDLKAYDSKANTIAIDEIEWVLQDNIKRINELGLNSENDFPNGFYIYNKKIENITRKIAKDAEFSIIKGSEQKTTDKAGFAKRIKEYQSPYVITIKGDTIVKIAEQYVP